MLSTQVSQMVLSAHLNFLQFITTVWAITYEISYLREFSAQKRQIVISAHLTVLRIITTVWAKISKSSYLREFSAQVSQIVYSAQLTVLTAYYNCMKKKFKNFTTPYVNYTSITNRFLSSFDRFTVFTTVRRKISKISLIRDFSAQTINNRVLSSFDRFTASYNCMRKNFKKSPISVS